MKLKNIAAVMGLTMTAMFAGNAAAVDENLVDYNKTTGISGTFSSTGSDTLANMMTFWAEEYKRAYPTIFKFKLRVLDCATGTY